MAAIDFGQLAQVVWVSLVAGLAATIAYSLVVLGTGRCAAARRAGRGGVAVAYATLAARLRLAFAGGVVLAVEIMLQ